MGSAEDVDAEAASVAEEMATGWPLVWSLAVAQLVSWGTLYYSFSLLLLPMQAELGWTKPQINGALSVGLVTAGLCAYPIGSWIDRYGGRAVMSSGSVLGALLLFAWSRVDTLGTFYAIWIGMGVAMAATLYEPAFAVLTHRFPRTFARRILSVTLVAGFASTVFVPLAQLLVDRLGWRAALVALACCGALVSLPCYAFLPRSRTGAARATGEELARGRRAVASALRRPAFWGLALSFTAYQAAFAGTTFHLVPLLFESHVPTAVVLAAVALIGPSQVAGRLLLLTRGEYAIAPVGRATVLLLPGSLLIVAALPPSPPLLWLFAVLYGGGVGVMTIVRGTSVPAIFGSECYGAINGALVVPINLAAAAAPLATAVLRERSGSYALPLAALVASALIAAISFWATIGTARPLAGSLPRAR